MFSTPRVRTLCAAACTAVMLSASHFALAADPVKIGFLVKQPEEPWFQTEWAFAEKAAKDKGFTLLKIAVPDGEKTLSAIDSLAANGAKGFVICPPDVSLGPSIVAKAKAADMKVMAVDDRFVGADGKFMEDVPYLGMAAFEVGQKQGNAMAAEAQKRGWKWDDTYAVINTYDELDTGKKRTDGSVDGLKKAGLPADHIVFAPQKTLDVPGGMDAANAALVKLPGAAKHLIIGGMNDNTVLGGVRATETAGFKAADVIGIGINGTDAKEELKKADSGFYGSLLPSPHIEGYNTSVMMYEWVTTGKEPPKYTAMDEVTLITRQNFKQELEKIGLWN